LEATDKLDKRQRNSPPSRELVAQGVGNITAGMIGGIPVTSVIVRGSVNVMSGSNSKLSTILHGVILLVCVALFPYYLNMIPLSALAAILLVTGFKLASPKLFAQMWSEGRYQLIPFLVTVLAIVFTDLLIGILLGLAVSVLFILNSSLRSPVRRIVETYLDGDVIHVELANQVSFLNRAALDQVFDKAPPGSRFLVDATDSDYIDPDILSLVREFKDVKAPARGIKVSLRGFREKYNLKDEIQFADYSTRELQDRILPQQVIDILSEGNRRFCNGTRLTRDFNRQVYATSASQNPLAVVLSCIDSRVPAELVFDLGIGDIFSVRVAGNVIGTKSLGSIEYGVTVAGVKLVVVLGHTRCGAVTSSVELLAKRLDTERASGCQHLHAIVQEIQMSANPGALSGLDRMEPQEKESCIDDVARKNVVRTVYEIVARSQAIHGAVQSGRAIVVGGMYDVKTGEVTFLPETLPAELSRQAIEST
ncbi:MAG: sulfate transporter, partial [Planctomycetales bacterium]|nr:sulfate transporter [Planctomycetales bacterium]